MQNIWKCLTGIIVAFALLENDLLRVFTNGCKISKINGKFVANHSYQRISVIPQVLSDEIEILDLSGNIQMNLLEDSFGNYVKLSELIMKNLKVNANGTKTSPFTFTPLTKLKMIDMEAAGYIGSAFNWPPNISVMNVNKNALRDFDVTNLYKLQRLSVNGNNLRDVPKIHQLAPLTELHAKQNQLDYLTAESLAYYCLLETLELDLHEDSKLNKAEKYCQCARVEKWLHNVNITVNVSLGCRRTAPRDANCSFEFSEAMAIRAKCLERHSRVDVDIDINEIRTFNDPNFDTVKALQNWSWQVAIPLFIVVALALIFMVCNKFKSSKRRIPSETSPQSESEAESNHGKGDEEE